MSGAYSYPYSWNGPVGFSCARAWTGAGPKWQRNTGADVAHFPLELTFWSSFDYNVAHGLEAQVPKYWLGLSCAYLHSLSLCTINTTSLFSFGFVELTALSPGTGLFISSGSALNTGGPASVLLAYMIIGLMLYCVMQALGELAVVFPIAGSFSAYSTRFLDPAWGFAMGWK